MSTRLIKMKKANILFLCLSPNIKHIFLNAVCDWSRKIVIPETLIAEYKHREKLTTYIRRK